MKKLGLIGLPLLLLAGCVSTSSRGPISVNVAQDMVNVPTLGIHKPVAAFTTLPPGVYRFNVKRRGYRQNSVTITVKPGQKQQVRIPWGTGYAHGSVAVEAPYARQIKLQINAKVYLQRIFTGDLDAGTYLIQARAVGYAPYSGRLVVKPGRSFHRVVSLKPLARVATLRIFTAHANTEIWLNGKRIGRGHVSLSNQPFATYRFHTYRYLNQDTRWVGEKRIDLNRFGGASARIVVTRKERRFHGVWYPEAVALSKAQAQSRRQKQAEETAYRAARIAHPVQLDLSLAAMALHGLQAKKLAVQLQQILRVGDRVRITLGAHHVLIWKRQATLSPAFQRAVQALFAHHSWVPAFPPDPSVQTATVRGYVHAPVARVAFALYGVLFPHPLIGRDAAQLGPQGVVVQRDHADGAIAVLAHTTHPITLNGHTETPIDALVWVRLAAANQRVDLRWTHKPDHLLVVSTTHYALPKLPGKVVLDILEKRPVVLLKNHLVVQVMRITSVPGSRHWQHQTFKKVGPLDASLDFSHGEYGPANMPGLYRRIWIVVFKDGSGGLTQRQQAATYQVGHTIKNFASDKFIRRTKKKIKK